MAVLDNKADAAAVVDDYSSIERIPDKSAIFCAELHALYLAFDWVEKVENDERNFIVFPDSKSALQAIWNEPNLLSSRYWDAFIG